MTGDEQNNSPDRVCAMCGKIFCVYHKVEAVYCPECKKIRDRARYWRIKEEMREQKRAAAGQEQEQARPERTTKKTFSPPDYCERMHCKNPGDMCGRREFCNGCTACGVKIRNVRQSTRPGERVWGNAAK